VTRRAIVRGLRRWGWPLPAGVALVALAGAVVTVVVPRWEAEADAARERATRLRLDRAAAEHERRLAQRGGPDAESWPPAERASERAADLLEQAMRHGVDVQRTQQRVDRVAGAAAEVIRLQQTVRASYPDLRRFAGTMLLADPALGLERIRLQRGSPAEREYEGELSWALVQQTAGAAP
jgi:hypothetical protein